MYPHHLRAAETRTPRGRFPVVVQPAHLVRPTRTRRSPRIHPPSAATTRAAVPTDRDALAQMLRELSPRSSYLRFFSGGFRVTERVLDTLLCTGVDGRAFVALDGDRIVAHAMWAVTRADEDRADIAFVVAEDRRGHGLATRLTRIVLDDAAERGLLTVEATVLADNVAAQRVVRRLLPDARIVSSHGEISYTAALTPRGVVTTSGVAT